MDSRISYGFGTLAWLRWRSVVSFCIFRRPSQLRHTQLYRNAKHLHRNPKGFAVVYPAPVSLYRPWENSVSVVLQNKYMIKFVGARTTVPSHRLKGTAACLRCGRWHGRIRHEPPALGPPFRHWYLPCRRKPLDLRDMYVRYHVLRGCNAKHYLPMIVCIKYEALDDNFRCLFWYPLQSTWVSLGFNTVKFAIAYLIARGAARCIHAHRHRQALGCSLVSNNHTDSTTC